MLIRSTILLWLLAVVAFCQQSPDNFWKQAGYSDSLAVTLANTRSGEMLAEKLQSDRSPQAIFELGRLYYARGLYRQALAFFNSTDFGGDTRLLHIGFCHIVLGENDSASTILSRISDARLRAWSAAGLARISNTVPTSANDYPYLSNFFMTETPDTVQKKGFTLQFGAFADSLRATGLVEILRDIGLSPYMTKAESGGKMLFRVRAEHFATREEAEEAGAALGDQFIYMVVPE